MFYLSVIVSIIFFGISFIYIMKRSKIFSVYYTVLFIYGMFTAIGYVYYPKEIAAASGGQYYGIDAIFPYMRFIILSLVSIWILYIFVFKKLNRIAILVDINSKKPGFYRIFGYTYFNVIYGCLLWGFIFMLYGQYGYDQQDVIKETRGVLYLLKFVGILILLNYIKYEMGRTFEKRVYYLSLLLWILVPWVIIMIRGGSRDEIAMLSFAYIYYLLVKNKPTLSHVLIIVLVGLVAVYSLLALQIARRMGQVELGEFVRLLVSPQFLLQDYVFSPTGLLLQDFTGPALALVTSIQNDLIFTYEAIKSVIFNWMMMSGYPSLGFITSRFVTPLFQFQWQGYGYYILTEGYNVAGWYGIIYNAIVFNLGLYVWHRITNSNDRYFNAFIESIIAMQVIDVIRGQSSTFVRGTYMYIIPAILLYFYATGIRAKFIWRKISQ